MTQAEADLLIQIADDELILGWRNSEWTGIAPLLEEDVAFSSIAQNEIGHARAVYELLADDADALAFDRKPDEYRCAPLVELHLLDWAHTIARRWLYEVADEIRITALKDDPDPAVAGLAAKVDREEAYHRMHAEMWHDRLRDEPRFRAAVEELWPYALGVLPPELRGELVQRVSLAEVGAAERATEEKIAELGAEPEVEVITDDSWSTDRITPAGREKLREAGFAPPAPREASAPTLVQLQANVFRCPYCGSTETRLDNIFGPTPCRSLRYCESCRQPFEQFKTI